MKIYFTTVMIILLIIMFGCSSEEKGKKIIGKWKTVNNQNNSQIILYITDSTILSEFWFDEGIKKIQYSYKIVEETDSSLIIQNKNYFNILTMDTIYLDSSRISFATQDGAKFDLIKQE